MGSISDGFIAFLVLVRRCDILSSMPELVGCPVTIKPAFIRPSRAKFQVVVITMPSPLEGYRAIIFIVWSWDNPVKYTDPDGRDSGYALDKEGLGGMGHAAIYTRLDYGNYALRELSGISIASNGIDPNVSPGDMAIDK
jgi:hypothetical protein